MSQPMRFEGILRKLAIVDEGFADDQARLVLGASAVWGIIGLGRMTGAAAGVAGAFGYDIEAALEDPDGH